MSLVASLVPRVIEECNYTSKADIIGHRIHDESSRVITKSYEVLYITKLSKDINLDMAYITFIED